MDVRRGSGLYRKIEGLGVGRDVRSLNRWRSPGITRPGIVVVAVVPRAMPSKHTLA
jgi:hypothetical protein